MDSHLQTVLVVEDDAVFRTALRIALTGMECHVLTAADPDAAYALLTSRPVDRVLLDIRLPTMSGLSLYLTIVYRWPQLEGRIALMTGHADAPDVRLWLGLHPCTLFRKPFRFGELLTWLDADVPARVRHAAS